MDVFLKRKELKSAKLFLLRAKLISLKIVPESRCNKVKQHVFVFSCHQINLNLFLKAMVTLLVRYF